MLPVNIICNIMLLKRLKTVNICLKEKGVAILKNRIKEVRENKNMSQNDVADELNVTRQSISQYENGHREPKLETWKKLAKLFNASVPYLQGLTISESEVIKVINDTYLCEVKDFLAYEKETPNNFDYNAFIKSKNPILNISHSVNMYLLVNKITLPLNIFSMVQLEDYSNEVKEYWTKNFSFIFNETIDVNVLQFSPWDTMARAEKHSLIDEISFCISTKYLTTYETDISRYYEETDFYHDISVYQKNSEDLIRFSSKNEIKIQVNKIIKDLNTFLGKLDKLPDNPPFYMEDKSLK